MSTATNTTTRTITDPRLRLAIEKEARGYDYPIIDAKKNIVKLHKSGQRSGVKFSLRREQGQGRWRTMLYAHHVEQISDSTGQARQLFCMEANNVTLDDLTETVRAAMSAPQDAPASTETPDDTQPAASDSAQPHADQDAAQTPDPVDWSAFKRSHCSPAPTWARWAAHLAATRKPVSADVARVVQDGAVFDRSTGGYDYIDPVTAEVTPF